jgi:hypothetical protein
VVEAPEVVGFAAQAAAAVLLNTVLSIRIDCNKFVGFVFLQIRIRTFSKKNLRKTLMFALWFRFNHSLYTPNLYDF